MTNKIDKLNEAYQLLKSGAISDKEFEALKNEIINNDNSTFKNNTDDFINKADKEKIILKAFTDSKGKTNIAPDIQYLNLKDISENELKLLKPFIRKKQIHAPGEMTNDEINIGNKIFTPSEIAEMNSEREGFNYAFGSIISVLSAGAALYFIILNPCMIYLGAGGGGLASLFIALTILSKPDATKYDKTACYIALTLLGIAIIVFNTKW